MAKEIKVTIEEEKVEGTGTDLFAVIRIDDDHDEDTIISLWRADNEDHLFNQLSEEFYDGEDPETFVGPNFEEEIWRLVLLPKWIGTVE